MSRLDLYPWGSYFLIGIPDLLCATALKVSKFQNEFMKSSFLPKYELKIVKISALHCDIVQGRNQYNIWFIFWEKR